MRKPLSNSKSAALSTPLYRVSFKTKHSQASGAYLPKKSVLETKFRKIRNPSTLFQVIVKQFNKFWVIVSHSVNIVGHSGTQWLIVVHSTVQHSPIGFLLYNIHFSNFCRTDLINFYFLQYFMLQIILLKSVNTWKDHNVY